MKESMKKAIKHKTGPNLELLKAVREDGVEYTTPEEYAKMREDSARVAAEIEAAKTDLERLISKMADVYTTENAPELIQIKAEYKTGALDLAAALTLVESIGTR